MDSTYCSQNSFIYDRKCLNTTRGNQIYRWVQKEFESLQRSTELQSLSVFTEIELSYFTNYKGSTRAPS